MQDEFTVVKIHRLINHELLEDNMLKNEFKEKIYELDIRMKKFLIPSIASTENWWKKFNEIK
jgi:hypothetical protein